MESVEFLSAYHSDISPMQRAAREEARRDALDKAEAERQATEKQQHREAWILGNALAGDPAGQVTDCQRRMGSLQDRERELDGELEKVRERIESERSNLEWLAGELLLVEESATRSAPITDPVHNGLVKAREEHQRMVENARERDREMAGHRRRLDGLWRARLVSDYASGLSARRC
jgi:hypothetical protein